MAVSNASLGNLFLTIKADAAPALRDIKKVIVEAERAAKAVDALNKAAGRVQAPRTPAAPRTPSTPSGGGAVGGGGRTRGTQKQLSELDKVEKKLRDIQTTSRNIGKSNDAVGAELASDALLKKVSRLRAELKTLLPSLKTNEEKAKLQGLLGTLEQVNKQTREGRRVAKFAPDKVIQTGSVNAAVKAVQAEEAAAVKARQQARAKGIADAKKYLEDLQKARAKARIDGINYAKKEAQRIKNEREKARQAGINYAKKELARLNREKQQAANAAARAAAAAQKAADRAAKTAQREAERAAKAAQKLAEKTAAKLKSGVSGLTTGLFSNVGRGAAKGVADLSASLAALRYGNIFGGIASGARAITGIFTSATKTATEFGGALSNVGAAAGPLAAALGLVVGVGLVAAGQAAVKAAISFAGFAAQAAALGLTLKTLFTTGFSGATELEKSGLTLEAVLGRRAKAEEEYLIQRDRASLYDFTGLQELDRTLLAFNVTNDETRRGLVDTLVTLGTVGGRSVEQLGFAARALGQISANGTPLRQDILQLVQSLGVSERVLQSLPEYAGKSSAELRKMLEQGLIPSVTFFKALGVYAEQFGPIAAKAAGTFEGQVNNIKDTLRTGLAKAFLDTGVLAAAADLAAKVLAIISKIDFKPIGAGFRAVIEAITLGFGGVIGPGSAGDTVKNFFEKSLPNALYGIARVAYVVSRFLGGVFKNLVDGLNASNKGVGQYAESSQSLLNAFVKQAKAGAAALKISRYIFAIAKTILAAFIAVGGIIGKVVEAVIALITGDFSGAGRAIKGVGGVYRDLLDNLNPKDDLDRAAAEYDKFVASVDKAAKDASTITFSPFTPQEPTGDGLPDQQAFLGNEEANSKAEELRNKIDDLRNQLYELTRRIYGLRSELEKGLIGEVGFDATKEQIAQIGSQVTDILRQLGKGGLAAAIDRQVVQLMRLADLRDAVAKELEDANKRLEDAIKARDEFAAQIRKQAIDFVNALSLEEQTVDRIKTFRVGGITGYLVAQVKESQKYVDVLRKRLATFRDFQRKTKQLAQRGLDKGVLEQLVAAGPEQAGTIVDQLSQSGDDVIREVNAIQRELGQVAKDSGESQAALFYQAGVDQARAQAAGLLSQIAYLASVAELLGQAIYNAVVPYAKKTGDAVASAVAPPAAAPRRPAAPSGPSAEEIRNQNLARLLLVARKQINDSVLFIDARTKQMTSSWAYSFDQIQNTRKLLFQDLVNRYSGLTKVPDATGYNIGIYIGGEKIGEYVDIALRDKYDRAAAGRRQGSIPGNPIPGGGRAGEAYPGGFAPSDTFNPTFGR